LRPHLAEGLLTLWLLIKGVNAQRWEKRARAADPRDSAFCVRSQERAGVINNLMELRDHFRRCDDQRGVTCGGGILLLWRDRAMPGYYTERLAAERLRACYDLAPPRTAQS
jgi:hypothetical protein